MCVASQWGVPSATVQVPFWGAMEHLFKCTQAGGTGRWPSPCLYLQRAHRPLSTKPLLHGRVAGDAGSDKCPATWAEGLRAYGGEKPASRGEPDLTNTVHLNQPWGLESTGCSYKGLKLPAPTWLVTAMCNPRFRGSNTFWPQWAPGTQRLPDTPDTDIHICKQLCT